MKGIPSKISEAIFQKIRTFPNKTQLAVAVIRNGNTEYYGAIKENDSLNTIINKDSIFEIGSITKVFTATVLANLVISKKIELNTDINQYFDFSFKDKSIITMLSLANHTSGLPTRPINIDASLENLANHYENYDEDMMKEYLQHYLQLNYENENRFEYSNFGYALLSYTLELSQGKSFKELLQQLVFDKYKMANTYTDRSGLKSELVIGLDANGNETKNWDMKVYFGAGGVLSSVGDLSKFVSAHFVESNEELALTRKATYTVDEEMEVGLSLQIMKRSDNNVIYWHNGGTGGYKSAMVFDTVTKSAAIILSNVSVFHPDDMNIDSLCVNLTGL